MKYYDILLFDADDTLFDFHAASRAAIALVMSEFGIEPLEEFVVLYEAVNAVQWLRGDKGELTQAQITENRFRFFLQALGRENIDPIAMNERYKVHLAGQSILFSGAESLIRGLHNNGYRLAIVTNGLAQVQHGRFADCPITPYFEGIFISEEVGARKPQPAFFHHVFAAMGIEDTSRVAMIGDNLQSDILGGNLVKIDTIWYNPKGVCETEIKPTMTVANYGELLAALEGAR